jgi:hypothetical protein
MPYGMNSEIYGYTERHIRSVKHCLAALISQKKNAKILSSPDSLLLYSRRSVSEVRLPRSAGMDPDRSDSDEVGCFAMECNRTPLQTTTSNFSCVVRYASHLIDCYPIDPAERARSGYPVPPEWILTDQIQVQVIKMNITCYFIAFYHIL